MPYIYNSKIYVTLACLLITSLLAACGPLQIRDAQTGNWVPFQTGTLELHHDVNIPAERTRVFFQDGAQVSRINEFKPFCQLEVTRLRPEAQTVLTDSFAITRVGRKTETVVATDVILVASLVNVASLDRSDGGPLRVTEILYFQLRSDRQPMVRELACGGAFDSPGNADAPTLQEIAAALGEHATLTLR